VRRARDGQDLRGSGPRDGEAWEAVVGCGAADGRSSGPGHPRCRRHSGGRLAQTDPEHKGVEQTPSISRRAGSSARPPGGAARVVELTRTRAAVAAAPDGAWRVGCAVRTPPSRGRRAVSGEECPAQAAGVRKPVARSDRLTISGVKSGRLGPPVCGSRMTRVGPGRPWPVGGACRFGGSGFATVGYGRRTVL
jgi:hypothetical protein